MSTNVTKKSRAQYMLASCRPKQFDCPPEVLLVCLQIPLQAVNERRVALVVHNESFRQVGIGSRYELVADIGTNVPTLVQAKVHDLSLHLVAQEQDVLHLQEYHVVVFVQFVLDGFLVGP